MLVERVESSKGFVTEITLKGTTIPSLITSLVLDIRLSGPADELL